MKFFIHLFFLLSISYSFAQINNEAVFGAVGDESVINSRIDSNNIILAYSIHPDLIPSGQIVSQGIGGLSDLVVQKITDGQIVFEKVLGSNLSETTVNVASNDLSTYVVYATNGGATGTQDSPSFGEYDIIIIKLDNQGTILWQKRFGGESIDYVDDIELLQNGELIVTCMSFSGVSGNKTTEISGDIDVWVLKLNEDGELLWQKNLGGDGLETDSGIMEFDNSIVVYSRSNSGVSGNKTEPNFSYDDTWIVKLDQNGNIIDQLIIESDNEEYVAAMELHFGSLFCLMSSNSTIAGDKTIDSKGDWDLWLVEFNNDFEIVNQWVYGGTELEFARDLYSNGKNLLVLGESLSGISGNKTLNSYGLTDYWLIEVDLYAENPFSQWSFGGNRYDNPGTLWVSENGQVRVGGTSYSGISGNKTVTNNSFNTIDYWTFDFEAALNVPENELGYNVYPNPSHDNFFIQTPADFDEIFLFDLVGNQIDFELRVLSSGIKEIVPLNFSKGFLIMQAGGFSTKLLRH